MFKSLKERLPTIQQVLAIYGIISLLISGWTLIVFFWRLPSWEYILTFGEISTIFAYSMSVNLLESLVVLFPLLLLSIVLPKSWFRDSFLSEAFLLVILGLIYTMYIAMHISSRNNDYPTQLVRLIPVIGSLIVVLTLLIGRIPLVRKLTENLADRFSIFSYVFLPISLISLLIVIVRNVF